jgi:branched-chain amino acid transport system substrate-binding protein
MNRYAPPPSPVPPHLAGSAPAQAQTRNSTSPCPPTASALCGRRFRLYGGIIDYFNLVNQSGGVNGVKISWEECETEYNAGVECYERLKTKNGGATGGTRPPASPTVF